MRKQAQQLVILVLLGVILLAGGAYAMGWWPGMQKSSEGLQVLDNASATLKEVIASVTGRINTLQNKRGRTAEESRNLEMLEKFKPKLERDLTDLGNVNKYSGDDLGRAKKLGPFAQKKAEEMKSFLGSAPLSTNAKKISTMWMNVQKEANAAVDSLTMQKVETGIKQNQECVDYHVKNNTRGEWNAKLLDQCRRDLATFQGQKETLLGKPKTEGFDLLSMDRLLKRGHSGKEPEAVDPAWKDVSQLLEPFDGSMFRATYAAF